MEMMNREERPQVIPQGAIYYYKYKMFQKGSIFTVFYKKVKSLHFSKKRVGEISKMDIFYCPIFKHRGYPFSENFPKGFMTESVTNAYFTKKYETIKMTA